MANFQLHYVNTGTEAVMREAWVNLYFKDEAAVTDKLNAVFLVGDLGVNVQPGVREITHLAYAPTLSEPTRLYELAGHAHAHTERFTAWRTQDGVRGDLLYETYDWAEPAVITYNSLEQNPAPSAAEARDGGFTGLVYLEQGQGLEWECEVNNTSDAPLNFANEAYTAEMCLLAGAYVSDTGGLLSGGCFNGVCGDFGNF